MSDKSKITVILILAGVAFVVLAGPVGNWIGRLSASPDAESPETPRPLKTSAANAPLPLLHLKREMVKPQSVTEDTEEPKLPAPKPAVENAKTLSNDEIDAVLQQRQPQFLRCWTQRLKDKPNLTGKMDVQFEIFPRGKVQGVRVIDSTIEDDTMSRCIVSVLERVQFREFRGASITLTFPMRFE